MRSFIKQFRHRSIMKFTIVMLSIGFLAFSVPESLYISSILTYTEVARLGRGLLYTAAWRPDGDMVAAGSSEGIWLYTATLEDIKQLTVRPTYKLNWRPDGMQLASWGLDGITVWDAESGDIVLTIPNGMGLGGWSPDGTRLAVRNSNNEIEIWAIGAREVIAAYTEYSEHIYLRDVRPPLWGFLSAIAWNPDGIRLACVYDARMVVWNTVTGDTEIKFNVFRGRHIVVGWSADGTRLATASYDGTGVWNVATGELLTTLRPHKWVSSDAISWDPSAKKIASAWADFIAIWDSETYELLSEFHLWGEQKFGFDELRLLDWNRDGKRLLTGTIGSLQIVDTQGGQVLASSNKYTGPINDVEWSQDSSRLAVAYGDTTFTTLGDLQIRIWNVQSKRVLNNCMGVSGPVTSIDWSPSNEMLVSSDGSFYQGDYRVRTWNVTTCELLGTNADTVFGLTSAKWKPDGSQIAAKSCSATLFWRDYTLGEHFSELGPNLTMDAWSPSGEQLAGTYCHNLLDGNEAVIYDLSEQTLHILTGHINSITTITWSPDGKRLASGSKDRTIRIWDVESEKTVVTLNGHSNEITALAWRPNSTQIASASADHTIRIWDTTTGKELAVLEGHGDNVTSVAWSPDGSLLASGSYDGTVLIWHQ